ncbi:hypothetical protein C8R46DRAFT_1311049 [Mycena filopes]|nr:hypothetical protein C8R46DRAFT_1311049 [Mycena filopes]
MEIHLRGMKTCAEELRTFGYPLDDKVLSLALLTSMPDSWDSWISSMALDEALLKNPSKVTSAITMEARRLTAREPNDPTAALVARSRRTTPREKPQPPKPTPAPASKLTSDTSRDRRRCYNCGGIGHLSADCPSDRDVAGVAHHVPIDSDGDYSDDEDYYDDYAFGF